MITEIDVTNRIAQRLDDEKLVSFENVVDETLITPSDFPCVSIIEMDSYQSRNNLTFDMSVNHRTSVFEVQAYCNDMVGAKYHVAEIMDFIVNEFAKLGYRCTTNAPVSNMADSSIKRRVARFTRVIGEGDTLA